MSGWISVKGRSPEDRQCVIATGFIYGKAELGRWVEPCVYADGEYHPIGYDDVHELCADLEGEMNTTTHWMPLPVPPTE